MRALALKFSILFSSLAFTVSSPLQPNNGAPISGLLQAVNEQPNINPPLDQNASPASSLPLTDTPPYYSDKKDNFAVDWRGYRFPRDYPWFYRKKGVIGIVYWNIFLQVDANRLPSVASRKATADIRAALLDLKAIYSQRLIDEANDKPSKLSKLSRLVKPRDKLRPAESRQHGQFLEARVEVKKEYRNMVDSSAITNFVDVTDQLLRDPDSSLSLGATFKATIRAKHWLDYYDIAKIIIPPIGPNDPPAWRMPKPGELPRLPNGPPVGAVEDADPDIDDVCAICLNGYGSGSRQVCCPKQCQNKFHAECLGTWLDSKPRCPVW